MLSIASKCQTDLSTRRSLPVKKPDKQTAKIVKIFSKHKDENAFPKQEGMRIAVFNFPALTQTKIKKAILIPEHLLSKKFSNQIKLNSIAQLKINFRNLRKLYKVRPI